MPRIALPLAALAAALSLAACNETNGSGLGPTTAATAAPQTSFRLPPGQPCSAEIGRYDSVVKDDLRTGNVEQKVYDQIQSDLSRAASACSAGQGGQAHALVAASKARHGYRA